MTQRMEDSLEAQTEEIITEVEDLVNKSKIKVSVIARVIGISEKSTQRLKNEQNFGTNGFPDCSAKTKRGDFDCIILRQISIQF